MYRMPNDQTKNTRRRAAVTLIELLIVMAVVVLLAGLTLPTIRATLKDQRVTECARIFQSLVEGARAKAIYTGRPVSLVLERVPGDNSSSAVYNHTVDNTVARISMGEVFPPYEGDWSGTTGTIRAPVSPATVPTIFEIPLAKVASLYDSSGTPTGIVQRYDLLQFGEHSQRFLIDDVQRVGATVVITFANPSGGFKEAQWTVNGETRFRVYRQPTKSMVGAVPLPRGTCIDLTNSGIGMGGRNFEVGMRSSPLPEFSSLAIVFNSRGTVDGAYYYNATGRQDALPTGLFHFQVGRPEQVVPSSQLGSASASATSSRDDFLPNLYDTSTLWVTLNPYSGVVYTTQNFECRNLPFNMQLTGSRKLATQALSNGKN